MLFNIAKVPRRTRARARQRVYNYRGALPRVEIRLVQAASTQECRLSYSLLDDIVSLLRSYNFIGKRENRISSIYGVICICIARYQMINIVRDSFSSSMRIYTIVCQNCKLWKIPFKWVITTNNSYIAVNNKLVLGKVRFFNCHGALQYNSMCIPYIYRSIEVYCRLYHYLRWLNEQSAPLRARSQREERDRGRENNLLSAREESSPPRLATIYSWITLWKPGF